MHTWHTDGQKETPVDTEVTEGHLEVTENDSLVGPRQGGWR